jgi:hypothetical protein
MKKIIVILLLINAKSYSQEFNGINLSKSYSSVISELKQKGFRFSKKEQNYNIFLGKLKYDNVKVFLDPKGEKVKSLTVFIDEKNTWEDIENDFFYYRKLLIDKYGEPFVDKREFNYPYKLGDGFELLALKTKDCNYVSYFDINDNWSVGVTITGKQVLIIYINKVFNQQNQSEL